jgi:hypothetical protein
MLEGASPSLLGSLLDEFFDEIASNGAPVDRCVVPGLSREEIRGRVEQLGFSAPEEVLVWFGRHNGYRPISGERGNLPLPHDILSLDAAIDHYRSGPIGVETWEWGKGWLKVVSPVHGYALDCNVARPDDPLVVRVVGDGIGPNSVDDVGEIVSLCTLVAWWIDSVRCGAYRWDAGREMWEIDGFAVPEERRLLGFV